MSRIEPIMVSAVDVWNSWLGTATLPRRWFGAPVSCCWPQRALGPRRSPRPRAEPDPDAGPHPAGPANKEGPAGTWTHDYKRHGVTTLFAARDVVTGRVIGQCMPRYRHQEWLKFLRAIDRSTPKALDLHLITDNYATHKHPAVKA